MAAAWIVLQDALAVGIAVLAVPAIGSLNVYKYRPLGGFDALVTTTRLAIAALMLVWVSGLVLELNGTPASLLDLSLLGTVLVAGWTIPRQLSRVSLRRKPERVVVLGSGRVAERLTALADRHGKHHFRLIGYLDREGARWSSPRVPHLGGFDRLAQLVAAGHVDRILIGYSSAPDERSLEVLRHCDGYGVQVDIVPRFYGLIGPHPRVYAVGGLPILTVAARGAGLTQSAVKRLLDVVLAMVLLLVMLPVLLAIAGLICYEGDGRLIFGQERVGRYGKRFRMLKFRTMSQNAAAADNRQIDQVMNGNMSIAEAVSQIKAEQDSRITRVGAFLRATSLDELPQLFNVVRGDMSLVGPRPLRAFEANGLHDWQHDRHLMRPGMTGLWQVSGRSSIDWEERMELDYGYVRHWSLMQDVVILARTIPATLWRKGAR